MKSPYPLLKKSFLTLSFRIRNLRLFQKGFTSKNVLSLILTMLFTVSPESIA